MVRIHTSRRFAFVAQLVAQLTCNQQAAGSRPAEGSKVNSEHGEFLSANRNAKKNEKEYIKENLTIIKQMIEAKRQ